MPRILWMFKGRDLRCWYIQPLFHELSVARRVLTLDAGEATRLFPEHAVSGGYLVPHCN